MSAFIGEHRGRFGVEPICRILRVSASAYYQRASGQQSARAVQDERRRLIEQLHAANYYAYGYRRMWKALRRADEPVGRDRVKWLMRANAIQGAKRRGKPWRTTTLDPATMRPPDLINRNFVASRPDELWVADFCYLRTWEGDSSPSLMMSGDSKENSPSIRDGSPSRLRGQCPVQPVTPLARVH